MLHERFLRSTVPSFLYLSLYIYILCKSSLSFFVLPLYIPNHPPSFFPWYTFDGNRNRRWSGTARSLPRLTVHSPIRHFVVISFTKHILSKAQIYSLIHHREIAALLYTLYRKSLQPNISDECTDGGYRSGSENSTLSLERTCICDY